MRGRQIWFVEWRRPTKGRFFSSSYARAAKLTEVYASIADANITFELKGDTCRVSLTGRITIDSSPRLRTLLLQRLRTPGFERLTLDFAGVDCIDTSGLAILIEALRAARLSGKSVYLSRLGEQPRYLLEATRLLRLFDQVNAV